MLSELSIVCARTRKSISLLAPALSSSGLPKGSINFLALLGCTCPYALSPVPSAEWTMEMPWSRKEKMHSEHAQDKRGNMSQSLYEGV